MSRTINKTMIPVACVLAASFLSAGCGHQSSDTVDQQRKNVMGSPAPPAVQAQIAAQQAAQRAAQQSIQQAGQQAAQQKGQPK